MSQKKNTDDQVVKGFNPQEQDLAAMLKKSFENSDFTTTDEHGNQTFFGMKVDASTKNLLDLVFYQFIPHVAEQVQNHGAKFLAETAMSTGFIKDFAKASHFGKAAAPYLAMATVAAEPIFSLGATAVDTTSRVNELRKAVAPIAKTNNSFATTEALFNASNNEVIANARKKIYENAWTRVAGTIARGVATLPAIGLVLSNRKTRTKEMTDELERELALKDPESMKAYIEKHVNTQSKMVGHVEDQIQAIIKKEKEAWIKEFEAFKGSDAGKQASKKIEKLFKDESYLQEVGVSKSRNYIDSNKDGGIEIPSSPSARRELFKKRPELERAYERELKYAFVEEAKNGRAFSDEWVRPQAVYNNEGKRVTGKKPEGYRTIVDGYEEMRKSLMAKDSGQHAEAGGKGVLDKKILDQGIVGIATLLGTQLDRILVGDMRKEVQKPIALNLILHMRKSLEGVHEPVSVPNYGNKSGDSSISQFVHNVFEQHQEDCKKPLIGKHAIEHIQNAHFKDDVILQLKDEELTGYELAIKHITQVIKDGNMDAAALINLVGQRNIVQADGKNFGPKGSNGKPEAIIAEIDKQCACISAHQKISHEELSAIMGNILLTEADLKAGFAGGAFKGEERSFMFMLLDAQIKDEAALEKLTGLSKQEIEGLKKQGQQHFSEHFDAAITAIASMSNEEMGNLAKHNITVDEIKLIRAAAQEIQTTHRHASEALSGEGKQAVEQAVMNVLGAEAKDGQNFWQERVKKQAKDAIKEALEQEAPQNPLARLAAERNAQERGSDAHLGVGA